MKRLLTMGRGGTGKTTFVALMAAYFLERGETPLLLVDLDPDQSLAEMVGADLERAGRRTVSELLTETFIRRGGTSIGIPPRERIENRIWERGLYEGQDFDLLVVGTKWTEGCYCLPDAALKSALESLMKNYRYVLLDSPAGLEHLNRRISSSIDEIFDVIGPSKKSFDHVDRAIRITRELGIGVGRFSVVGGYLFTPELAAGLEGAGNFRYLGRIEYDAMVAQYVLEGRSLLALPPESPARASVARIMERAGYAA